MMMPLWRDILYIAIPILTGYIGHWFAKSKYKAEVDKLRAEVGSNEIENAERVLKYYRDMVDDLGGRLKEAISKLDSAEKMIRELEATVENLTEELKKYKQLNGKAK